MSNANVMRLISQNWGLLALVAAGLLWVGYTEGIATSGRYAIWLGCIVGDGLLMQYVLGPPTQRSRMAGIFLVLGVIALNAVAAYLVYPKVILLLAFCLPALIGFLVGKFWR